MNDFITFLVIGTIDVKLKNVSMKRIVMFFMLAAISLSASAQIERGRSSAGVTLGYGFDTENVTVGIDYRYALTNAIRVNPGLSHYIKKDGLKAWAIDLNGHYLVPLGERFRFYPLAGVNLSFWDQELKAIEPRDVDGSESKTRVGLNLGLGLETYVAERIIVGLEVKYLIISKVDQAMIGLRAGYVF